MTVTVPIGSPPGVPLSIQINGAAGGTVQVVIDGEACSIRKVVPVDAVGNALIIIPFTPCLGNAVLVNVRDGAGHAVFAATFRI